jgi:hypothetical protein
MDRGLRHDRGADVGDGSIRDEVEPPASPGHVRYARMATKLCVAAKSRDGPKGDMEPLFDRLIGAGDQCRWKFET